MKVYSGLAAAATLFSGNLAWARPDPAFEITQTAFSYTSTTETAEGAGDSTDTTQTAFDAMPPDLEIAMKAGKWIFAVFPTEPGAALEVTYEHSSRLGYGVGLSYTHAAADDDALKTDSTTFEFGPHANYDFDFGDNTVAFEARAGMTSAKSSASGVDEAQRPVHRKAKASGYEAELVCSYERMLTENFALSTGIGYTYGASKEKVAGVTTTTGELAVTVLQVHYGIYN